MEIPWMPHVLHLHATKISHAMFVLLRLMGMAAGKTAPDHEMASTSAPPFQ